jgi:hypothetical protein
MGDAATEGAVPITTTPAKCTLNSECPAPLVCSLGLCHVECETSIDCPANQRCVRVASGDSGTSAGVCQLMAEAVCHFNSDCAAPLVCAVDLQCRNQCRADRDCQASQRCVSGVCAEPREVNADGGLK